MDFSFNVDDLLSDEIVLIDNQLIPSGAEKRNQRRLKELVGYVIDTIGEASARAQKLNVPITTKEKFAASEDRIYVKKAQGDDQTPSKVVGFIKVGPKNLFLFDWSGTYREVRPTCVLDFYVHETTQRRGCGKQLFEFMLKNEGVSPQQLAINRPSSKFLSFLTRHYNLRSTIPQINNFVIFNNFFEGREVAVNRRQWNYGNDPESPTRSFGTNLPVRPLSMDRCHKNSMSFLPDINARMTEKSPETKSIPMINSANPRRQATANPDHHPGNRVSLLFDENRQEREKYSSTEIVDLTKNGAHSANKLKDNDRYSQHSLSTSHLNHARSQDTAWNIFGVSNDVIRRSAKKPQRHNKRETLFW